MALQLCCPMASASHVFEPEPKPKKKVLLGPWFWRVFRISGPRCMCALWKKTTPPANDEYDHELTIQRVARMNMSWLSNELHGRNMDKLSNELHGVNFKAIQRVARSQFQELTNQRVTQVNNNIYKSCEKKTCRTTAKRQGRKYKG